MLDWIYVDDVVDLIMDANGKPEGYGLRCPAPQNYSLALSLKLLESIPPIGAPLT